MIRVSLDPDFRKRGLGTKDGGVDLGIVAYFRFGLDLCAHPQRFSAAESLSERRTRRIGKREHETRRLTAWPDKRNDLRRADEVRALDVIGHPVDDDARHSMFPHREFVDASGGPGGKYDLSRDGLAFVMLRSIAAADIDELGLELGTRAEAAEVDSMHVEARDAFSSSPGFYV